MENPTRLERQQRAVRVSRLVLVLVVLGLIPVLAITSFYREIQLYIFSAAFSLLLLLSAVGMYFIQNGRVTRGVIIMLLGIAGTILLTPLLFDGVGVTMGLLCVFVVWQLANATLPPARAGRTIFVGMLLGILTVLLGLFDFSTRLLLPDYSLLLGLLSFALILAFGLLIWRNYRDYSVRMKLISVALFIILLIVSTTTLLTGRIIRNALTEEVGDDLQLLAQAQAFAVSELLGRQVNAVQALALDQGLKTAVFAQQQALPVEETAVLAELAALDEQWVQAADTDPLVRDRLNNAAATTLQQFHATFASHTELLVTDRYGGLVAASERPADFYQGDQAWWQAAFANGEGAIYIGEPERDAPDQPFSLPIAVPLHDHESKELLGILRTSYDFGELVELLTKGLNVDDTTDVDVWVNGKLLPLTQWAQQRPDRRIGLETLAPLQTESVQYVEVTYRDAPYFMSAAPLQTFEHVDVVDSLDWWVVLYQPQSNVMEPLLVQQRLNTLLGIVLAVIGGAIAAYAGNLLAKPIGALTETAVRVRNGDLEARAQVDSSDETGILAETFNSMTSQLQATLQNLDFRVRERTRALEVAAQIGRRISTILDEDELVTAVVEQIQKAFNYYHVHIYLLDPQEKKLIMANGTGQPGRAMRKYQHHMNLGEGLVGRSAATNITILAPDVTREPRWLPNKWLPETKAELSVPIATEKEVLGVLDVQRTTVGSLTEADANVLQLVANQVAIALQNARLYVLTQERAERQVLINQIGQQIQSTNSIEDAMRVAVRELGRALDADYTQVHLNNDK